MSEDCLSTLRCFKKLGVPIRKIRGGIVVRRDPGSRSAFRKFVRPSDPLDCGNSGTTMRLLAGVVAAQPFSCRLIGDQSLSRRPMRRIVEPLIKMGAKITSGENGRPPLSIKVSPRLRPISWESRIASAQVKSAVLLAGLVMKGKTVFQEPVRSRDHTERMLKNLGVRIHFNTAGSLSKTNRVTLWGGGPLMGVRESIPGDFSSAAYFLSAALILPDSKLIVRNVNLNPTRTGYLKVLKKMGADIRTSRLRHVGNEPVGDLTVRTSSLKGVTVGKEEIPMMIDEIPMLAVVASQAEGRTVINGAGELRVKESDRLSAITGELKKMGVRVREKKNGLVVDGPVLLRGAEMDSYHDHRMAMSLAVAALMADGSSIIRGFECVRISYPGFLRALKKLIR